MAERPLRSLLRGTSPIFLVLIAGLLAGCGSVTAVTDFVLPQDQSWERWAAHQPYSDIHVNHQAWDAFLETYRRVNNAGAVELAYRDVAPEDRVALDGYIEALSLTPVGTLNRREQLAYWVNLYNALTVQLVLNHYPVDSIREIEFGRSFVPSFLVGDGPWGEELVVVEGVPLSLDNIEQRILRPLFRDPRIHYVLTHAAMGSPDLMARSLDPARLNTDLNAAARAYVNSPRGVQVDGNRAGVSSIYTWFRDDFGGSEEAVLVHLRSYAAPELRMDLVPVSKVRDQGYDWDLNDTR
ncbi:DUF547 domain-containing protein [bacterium AH-315-P15]|nr:DUF547 domain-containing protein [bacterium AH-315-P15]